MKFAATEPAGDTNPDVFASKSQFLLAMGALRIDIRLRDGRLGRIETEIGRAELALDPLTQVLPIDLQFLRTLRAIDEQPDRMNLDHGINLWQRNKCRNLNTVALQLRIQKCTTFATVNHIGGHIFTAIRTRSPRPSGHNVIFPFEFRQRQNRPTADKLLDNTDRISRPSVSHLTAKNARLKWF
jgi:hypothetical protein